MFFDALSLHPSIETCQYRRYDRSMSTREAPSVTPVGSCCTPVTEDVLSAAEAEAMAIAFKALGDPTRLRLLSIVAASEGDEACVCDLTEPVGLSQPTVSHHLKQLVDAGLVTRDKRGVWAYYALRPGALDEVTGALAAAVPGRRPGASGHVRPR